MRSFSGMISSSRRKWNVRSACSLMVLLTSGSRIMSPIMGRSSETESEPMILWNSLKNQCPVGSVAMKSEFLAIL